MQIRKLEDNSWKVGDAEVWYHTQRKLLYCWVCSSYSCEHTQALWAHLTPTEADSADRLDKIGRELYEHSEQVLAANKPAERA